MAEYAGTVAIGAAAGVLSGMFGIGGGLVMVPALSLLLGIDGLTAVGTTLPVIIPSALTGAFTYVRAGVADWRGGLRLGLVGAPVAVLGALLAEKAGGTVVLLVLSAVVMYVAADTLVRTFRPLETPPSQAEDERSTPSELAWGRAAAIGAAAGLYSGFLGLGGGFVMVPLMTRFAGLGIKRAIGTSLVAISILALPGSISHVLLRNADLRVSALLTLGIVPGALLGAHLTLSAHERAVRALFALVLVATGVALIAREAGVL